MSTTETFFSILKEHRESKSIQIEEISEYTKINPKYIEAIEEGNFDILPNVYMRLFLRSYASYLDADSDLSDMRKSLEYSNQRIEYVKKTLKNIQDRNWNIKNAIDWRKFKEGAN